MTDIARNDPLLRKAEEFYHLPLRYEPGTGWVDRHGKPVKTHKWADIRRKAGSDV